MALPEGWTTLQHAGSTFYGCRHRPRISAASRDVPETLLFHLFVFSCLFFIPLFLSTVNHSTETFSATHPVKLQEAEKSGSKAIVKM